jgi:hypothetical protein
VIKFFLLSLILFSCQDYNSNSSDADKFGPSVLTGSSKFKLAFPILLKRCANCHTSPIHSPWAGYTKEQTWDDKNLIVPGNAQNSQIIVRTINTGGGGDMPQGGTALPDAEYQILLDWINSL